MKLRIILSILTIAVLTNSGVSAHIAEKGEKILIEGSVVAQFITAMTLTKFTGVKRSDIIIVRIDKLITGTEKSRYAITQYRYFDEGKMPLNDLSDASKQWQFEMERDSTCDSTVRNLEDAGRKENREKESSLPYLKRTAGAESEKIPNDTILPCYVLQQRDVKLIEKPK